MPSRTLQESTPTVSFDTFWNWLLLHPNCVLRAGTPEAVLYDDDDLHWNFASEQNTLLAQLVRGKRLVGELLIDPEQIAYVQGVAGDREGEFVFDLVVETRSDDETELAHDRAVH